MNKFELAWAAGFFDGEGCFVAQPQKYAPHPYLRVIIGQTDREVLDRFQKAVGIGGVCGPIKTKHKPMFSYYAASNNAIVAMNRILPWLSSVKRNQFHKAIGRSLTYYYLPKQIHSFKKYEGRT